MLESIILVLEKNNIMENYTLQWSNRIFEIDKSIWQNIFSNYGPIGDYDFILSVEKSAMSGIHNLYLSIYDSDKCCAIVPCFIYDFDLSILSGNNIKKCVNIVRCINKNFLKKNILFAGTPLAVCNHLLGINENIIGDDRDDLLQIIKDELKNKSLENNCSLFIIKEIPENQRKLYDKIFLDDMLVLNSLPNSYIVVMNKYMKFPNYLRSRYKKNINRKIRSFKTFNLKWEEKREYSEYVDTIYALYLNTFSKSKNKFEVLNKDLFFTIQNDYKNNSFVSIAKDDLGNIRAMILYIHDNKTLTPLYLGIDYIETLDSDIYFNCIYHIIELAEKFDYKLINLGQTSYNAKIYSGAFVNNLYVYVFVRNILLRKLIQLFSKYLFPYKEIEKHNCYTEEAMNIINKMKNNI